MTCAIYYATYYGSTQQYAEALAARLGATAEALPDPKLVPVAADAGPIVVLAPAHGPKNDGVAFIKKLEDTALANRPTCLATVGMTLDAEAAAADASAELLGTRADLVQRFYLPGRMNYSELTGSHKTVMRGIITALRLKPGKTENERAMIDAYGRDVDRVDLARLDPIVEWVAAPRG